MNAAEPSAARAEATRMFVFLRQACVTPPIPPSDLLPVDDGRRRRASAIDKVERHAEGHEQENQPNLCSNRDGRPRFFVARAQFVKLLEGRRSQSETSPENFLGEAIANTLPCESSSASMET